MNLNDLTGKPKNVTEKFLAAIFMSNLGFSGKKHLSLWQKMKLKCISNIYFEQMFYKLHRLYICAFYISTNCMCN